MIFKLTILNSKTKKSFNCSPKIELLFQHDNVIIKRTKRGVEDMFYDMFDVDDDDDSEDDDDDSEEEEEEVETGAETEDDTLNRESRFMSPLAFSKISETLGFIL